MTMEATRPAPAKRLAQVDSRKRLTVSEADANALYGVEIREDDAIVLVPTKYRTTGRRVKVDARRRLQLTEMHPWGLYFVTKDPRGIVIMEPAVAMPVRVARSLRQRIATT